MKRHFKQILPTRRYQRSLLVTTSTFVVVLLLINYLIKVTQGN